MKQKVESRMHTVLRIAAYPLVGLAFFYVFRSLWAYRDWLFNWQPSSAGLLLLLFSCLIYGLNSFLLSTAWCKLNHVCGQEALSTRRGIAIYGTSQIAKYIPGNIFHFLGRHAAGVRSGLLHSTLACSASLEILGLLFSAGLVSLAGVLLLGTGLKDMLPLPLWLISLVACASFILLVVALPGFLKKKGLPDELRQRGILMSRLSPVIGRYLLFFAVCGALLVLVTFSVVESPLSQGLLLVFFSYPISWLAGYVIPGASAGFGVREATLIVILSVSLPPQTATLIAILMRVVTVIGDLVFYLISKFIETSYCE